MTFQPFTKIARLNREIVVTEKIDGTNALIEIVPNLDENDETPRSLAIAQRGDDYMFAGSRSRYITPGNDNFGFARWASEHAEALWGLGYGRHYGEWWGAGVQRRYGLTEKRFSLFNTSLWSDTRPACCSVVPVLYQGIFSEECIRETLRLLSAEGSVAAPGFMDPEGVVIYHTANSALYKVTLKDDAKGKG